MNAPMTGAILEQVMIALQDLLDDEELTAVRSLEVSGQDVFVCVDFQGPGCRACKRTAREIRLALEALPCVDRAYVHPGPCAHRS